MPNKVKNKSKLKTKSKILVLGLILILLAGLFGPVENAQAQFAPGCFSKDGAVRVYIFENICKNDNKWITTQVQYDELLKEVIDRRSNTNNQTNTDTTTKNADPTKTSTTDTNGDGVVDSKDATPASTATTETGTKEDPNDDLFGSCADILNWTFRGCFTKTLYYLFLVLPSGILFLVAYFFNAMLALTLGTVLYENNFLPEAWRIIRDFSNIFFILVLLYISIKLILGLGGAEIKKMVVSVIVAALLINFSMFMTKVVIDASNILALIFYNKIAVCSPGSKTPAVKNGAANSIEIETGDKTNCSNYTKTINQESLGGVQEKDIAGAIVSGFNPARFLNAQEISDKAKAGPSLFEKAKEVFGTGGTANPLRPIDTTITNGRLLWAVVTSAASSGGDSKTLPIGISMIIIFSSGAIYLFASYAFFMAALAFIGRLIELWMLIIFSPFAFMSLSIPTLEKLDYLGWDAWLKRLLAVAFMAPMFMFFLLVISKLTQIDIFKNLQNNGKGLELSIPHLMVIFAIPAIIYISLLYKATEFAKKGAGDFGTAVIKYGTMAAAAVGGLALGAATGGSSMLLQQGVGRVASNITKEGSWLHERAQNSKMGRSVFNKVHGLGDASFDVRGIKIGGKTLASATGLNIGNAKEGGFRKARKDRNERERELDKKMDMGDDARAEMTRGRMDTTEAHRLEQKMIEGGMSLEEAARHAARMIESGVSIGESKRIARYVNATTRDRVSDNQERREVGFINTTRTNAAGVVENFRIRNVDDPTYIPSDTYAARARRLRPIMSANDRRLPAATAETNSNIGRIMSNLALANPVAPTPPPTP